MRLFSGEISSRDIEGSPAKVNGVVRLYTPGAHRRFDYERAWIGNLFSKRFGFIGSEFRFRLETDIGFKANIQVTSLEPVCEAGFFLMSFIVEGDPIALPLDASLGFPLAAVTQPDTVSRQG